MLNISDDPELSALLRVHREHSLTLDENAVHRLLTHQPRHFLQFLRTELEAIARGSVELDMTPKEIFHDGDSGGDFRLMPCVVRRSDSTMKTVKIIGTNVVQQRMPDQITVGKALVLDARENFVTHIIDACVLSSARTGACAALALELLAPRRDTLLLVGAGRVGYYALFYALAQGGVRDVVVADRERDRAEALVRYFRRTHPEWRFSVASPDKMPQVDAAILATTSTTPVCPALAWGAGLVVSLGADTDYQRELDPAWADAADIFVDTHDSARYGDIRSWLAEERVKRDHLRDLFDILANGVSGQRPRIFVSTGSALFDNLAISYLLRQDAPHHRPP